ncbi:MAG: hypothetical protein A3J74_03970 [Elusimicrobia bacterium RIFCSPHIGHO2_02_FULL_57_9]|nr:MAG: hypothetical protein A3J74_03970 [Elusimicrobia bacterium RIFCSPHIGHO2_02_FULL_57_9]
MPANKPHGLRVAVVGATGMVGRELLQILEKRRFPVRELLAFSSGKSQKTVRFRGKTLHAPAINEKLLASCALVFFVSSDEISQRLAPRLAKRGVWVIDDSAAFRLKPQVPLVIPEINAEALRPSRKLIAGPNCTMTAIAVAGFRLHASVGVISARIASYQSVSGAGSAALQELLSQARAMLGGGRPKASALPGPIAFNVLPQVGRFDRFGRSSEENKVAAELRKIWSAPKLRVSMTAVRVPVIRGHSLAAWLNLAKPVSPAKARSILEKTPGLKFARKQYPTPLSCSGRDPVYAGRVRQGVDSKEIALWIVSDNLLKGAALNSVQIAEELLRRRWLA